MRLISAPSKADDAFHFVEDLNTEGTLNAIGYQSELKESDMGVIAYNSVIWDATMKHSSI